jgi:hypothetical protein
MTKSIIVIVVNLVALKVAAKHELLYNKLASGVIRGEFVQPQVRLKQHNKV